MGLGLATLVSTNGNSCIEVQDVEGVYISGILLQAGNKNTETLLKFGNANQKYPGNVNNPSVLHDVFARVGGPDDNEVMASQMMQINHGHVIIDGTWLWRADWDKNGPVAGSKNPVETGLMINGDNVIGYGLASEHTLGDMLVWNGENGQSFMYQAEYPYDVTQQNYGDRGFVAYRVGDHVQNHEAWGIGAYSFFRDFQVNVESGIRTPQRSGIKFTNSLSVFLNGNGGINHVINDQGDPTKAGVQVAYQCSYGGSGSHYTLAQSADPFNGGWNWEVEEPYHYPGDSNDGWLWI